MTNLCDLWPVIRLLIGSVLGLTDHESRRFIHPAIRMSQIGDDGLTEDDCRELRDRLTAATGINELPAPRPTEPVGDYLARLLKTRLSDIPFSQIETRFNAYIETNLGGYSFRHSGEPS